MSVKDGAVVPDALPHTQKLYLAGVPYQIKRELASAREDGKREIEKRKNGVSYE